MAAVRVMVEIRAVPVIMVAEIQPITEITAEAAAQIRAMETPRRSRS